MATDFPHRLQTLRERRRIKRTVASQLCGLGCDAFKRYETGQTVPNIYTAAAIADFFEVSLDYLINGN